MRRYTRALGLIATAAACAATLAVPAGAQAQPSASFLWFPAIPQVGEPVSLASTSTDFTSPITGQSWDLAGTGVFREGGPVVTTTFVSAGNHLVRLRVTAADGSSVVAAQTIQVSPLTLPEILPFPVVRIAGRSVRTGVKLRLLSVEAPPGARIEVECRGRGCPTKRQSLLLASTRVEAVIVAFPRFERFLRAGVALEIRVSQAGRIGKYTRLLIRRGRPPKREDSCLEPSGTQAISCPAAGEA